MHEVSLVAAMVEQVEQAARTQGFERVTEVRVGIGAWSGVEASCVEFCFPEVTRGTVLDGARLVIEPIGVEMLCETCGARSAPPRHPADPAATPAEVSGWSCDRCRGTRFRLSRGKEFKVIDLEVLDREEG